METRKPHRQKEDYKLRTHMIHGNFDSKKWDYDHHVVPPVSHTTAYRLSSLERGARGFVQFASADEHLSGHIPIYIYDRLDEPTRSMLEENLAYAHGGEICVTFATGMAGISAALGAALRQGQEVVSHRIVYGCTYSLMTNWLPRFGMNVRFADFLQPESLAAEITPATRVLYFETPINPTLELIDIAAIRRVADQANAGREEKDRVLVIVDNTFATPFCQRPLRLGADLVVESLTKGLGGFGTDMGGAVIAAKEWYNLIMLFRKDFGGVLSPRSAWGVLVYGLPTLATRMINMQKTAQRVAEFLVEASQSGERQLSGRRGLCAEGAGQAADAQSRRQIRPRQHDVLCAQGNRCQADARRKDGGLPRRARLFRHPGRKPGANQDAHRAPVLHDPLGPARRAEARLRNAPGRHPPVHRPGRLARHHPRPGIGAGKGVRAGIRG